MKTIFNENSTKENNNLPHLQIDGKTVYYKEIIHTTEFIRLYKKESPIFEYIARINTQSPRPFIRLFSEDRKLTSIDKNNVVVIRICKVKTEAQFVTKLYECGVIRVPRSIVDTLDIKNQEKICIKIIAKNGVLNMGNSDIDLAEIVNYNKDIKIIPRFENFITFYHRKRIPFTLPRFIESSSKLVELLFLIHGDGHYKLKLYFVNKSPELHKFVLDEFENILRLPKHAWRCRILLHDLSHSNKSKKYWKRNLVLSPQRRRIEF